MASDVLLASDLHLIAFTVQVAALGTLLILPPGLLLALLLARYHGPGKSVMETALALPLVLPPTAIGIVLLEAFSGRTALGRALAALGLEVIFTWRGVLLATTVMALPLLVRSARTAFEGVDPKLVGLARTLGCSPLRAFLRVTLPLAWRGILAGALLAFARALGEFGATIMVAGNIPGRTQTAALAIFHAHQLGQDRRAVALAGVMAALAFLVLWTSEALARHHAARG